MKKIILIAIVACLSSCEPPVNVWWNSPYVVYEIHEAGAPGLFVIYYTRYRDNNSILIICDQVGKYTIGDTIKFN